MNVLLLRIGRRLLAGIGVLWGAATLAFLLVNLTGGDTALAILGGTESVPTPAVVARVRAEYHLDRPLVEQYWFHLNRLAHGDLGESYRLRIPVADAIRQQFGATAQLAVLAVIAALALALVLAITTAGRRGPARSFVSGLERVGTSVPSFVIGILALLLFSYRLHWLPASGQKGWTSLVLPVLTLSVPLACMLSQVLREAFEDVLEQPFITTARARGLSETGVRFGHALRHALIPFVTLSGTFFGMLLSNTVIAETLFSRQGLGRLMAEATSNKDVPLVLGVTMLSATSYVLVNLAVDLINAAIDPRTRAV